MLGSRATLPTCHFEIVYNVFCLGLIEGLLCQQECSKWHTKYFLNDSENDIKICLCFINPSLFVSKRLDILLSEIQGLCSACFVH